MSNIVQMIPLSEPFLNGNESNYVQECLASGWVSSAGPWVDQFEKTFSKRINSTQAVSLASGTASLHLALILAGVKPGDEVLVPTLTFIAPVNTVRYVGAEPVFMDCDASLNIDISKVFTFLKEECRSSGGKLINRKTDKRIAAIIPVHIHGHLVDIKALREICLENNIKIIEDATEALGSYWIDGSSAGTLGDFGCYSFNGNKIITTGGGGMLVAKDQSQVKHAKHLSTQAKKDPVFFEHDEVGYNYRLNSLQAALGIAQLEQLDVFVKSRRTIAHRYMEMLEVSGLGKIIREPEGTHSNYWLTAVRLSKGTSLKDLVKKMQSRGVQIRPVWALNHLQAPYKNCQSWNIKQAVEILQDTIMLPSSPNLTLQSQERVVQHLREAM